MIVFLRLIVVMIEMNYSILFLVLVLTTRFLYEELRLKLEVIVTKSDEERDIFIELEKWRRFYELVCRATDEINEIFGIPLFITIISYFPIAMYTFAFLIQSYSYAVRISFRYDFPDMINTLLCWPWSQNVSIFDSNNSICFMLQHGYLKYQMFTDMSNMHAQSPYSDTTTVLYCFLLFTESWLRIVIVIVFPSYLMDMKVLGVGKNLSF